GIARILAAGGAHVVAPAPGHDRPSTGELLAAIRGAGAPAVLLLPNDRNVRLAADAAAALADGIAVTIVPTRTPQEGIAALLAWDTRADAGEGAARMAAAAAAVRGASVATAVRDALVGGAPVRTGATIVLDADERLLAQAGEPAAAVVAALAALGTEAELVTLLYGADVMLADALDVAAAVEGAYPGLAVEVALGGQPHIGYLLAVE
ncbi:MAG: Dak phosphatase, partial [Chloroflexota bacterium]